MIDILEAADDLQKFCEARGWRFCFIGGLAVQRWSEARVTRDVDLTLLTGFGNEDTYIQALMEKYEGRSKDAAAFARRSRVLLLRSANDVGLDISLGAIPFEAEAVSRGSLFAFAPGFELRTCSAEDLIVFKLFASRPLDIRDAEGVAIRHKDELDWQYIERQLAPLAEVKDEPAILETLARLRLI
jgi:hypothetical protein